MLGMSYGVWYEGMLLEVGSCEYTTCYDSLYRIQGVVVVLKVVVWPEVCVQRLRQIHAV